MSSEKITIEKLSDVTALLKKDIITPSVAIDVTCKALGMASIIVGDERLEKQNVINEIERLDYLLNNDLELPTFFYGSSGEDFKVNDLFTVNKKTA